MRALKFALFIGLASAASGCVQMPTESAGVVDMRPQISFKSLGSATGATVLVDGLEVGPLQAYLESSDKNTSGTTLRVLPGTHQIRVIRGSDILLDERVYIGDGVTKTLLVK